MPAPAPHEISREDDIADGEQWRGNGDRDKEEVDTYSWQENNCCEDDSRHRIAGCESPICRISAMQVVDEQCRDEARAHIDQQHAPCAQTPLDDGAEGVERQHIEEQMSAIGMSEMRKKHALIIPACGNLARREEKHPLPATLFILEKPISEMSTFIPIRRSVNIRVVLSDLKYR